MTMTQAQHSRIVTVLTQQCQLIETAFIEEMTDHFVASVEARMSDFLSFDEALQGTIDDFGGPTNLQKMEWTYRKAFLKSLLRDWWGLVKSQFSKSKGLRTLIVVGLVTFLSLYLGLMADLGGVVKRSVLWSSIQWGSVLSLISLTLFLLQRVVPHFKKVGIIRTPPLLKTLLSYVLWAGALLLFLGLSSLELPLLLQCLSYSALWSTLAIGYLAFLDYSVKTDPDWWYQTR